MKLTQTLRTLNSGMVVMNHMVHGAELIPTSHAVRMMMRGWFIPAA